MGTLQEMTSGIRADVSIGLLLTAGLLSGCSRPNSAPVGVAALDTRTAAATAQTQQGSSALDGLKTPTMNGFLTLADLSKRDKSHITLNTDQSYLIDIPVNTFVEIKNATQADSRRRDALERTDDVFRFAVPSNDLSQYQAYFTSYMYCNQGRSSELDGTYLYVVDKTQPGVILSAVRLPTVDRINKNSTDNNYLIYLKTPDGFNHPVPNIQQTFSLDSHQVPGNLNSIHRNIEPHQSADTLR